MKLYNKQALSESKMRITCIPFVDHHPIVVEEFQCPNDPGAMLSGAAAPGKVSHGKVVLGEGSDKEGP